MYVESALSVRVYVHRRREKEIDIPGHASTQHRLNVVGVGFLKVVVAFYACIGRQRDRRTPRFIQPVIAEPALDRLANPFAAQRRTIHVGVESIGYSEAESEPGDRRAIQSEQIL